MTSLSQTMISRYVTKFSWIISEYLTERYIKFPITQDAMTETKGKFDHEFGFPGVLGVIDGTHITITALRKNIEYMYVNRKGLHSINVQVNIFRPKS